MKGVFYWLFFFGAFEYCFVVVFVNYDFLYCCQQVDGVDDYWFWFVFDWVYIFVVVGDVYVLV